VEQAIPELSPPGTDWKPSLGAFQGTGRSERSPGDATGPSRFAAFPEGPTEGITVHTVVVLPGGPQFTACDCAELQRILKGLIAAYRGRDVEVLITLRTLKSGRRAGRASGAVDVRDVPGRDGTQRWPTGSR
jgi:hypothetical protein